MAERVRLSALAGPIVQTIFVAGSHDFRSLLRIPFLRALPRVPAGARSYDAITLIHLPSTGELLVFPFPACIKGTAK
jgi:hypothetical protein